MNHKLTTAYTKHADLLFLPQEDGQVKVYLPIEVVMEILANKDIMSLDDPRYGSRSKDPVVSESH